MTILVRITHAEESASRDIKVRNTAPDGSPIDTEHVVSPGSSVELYVHSARAIQVTEGDPTPERAAPEAEEA